MLEPFTFACIDLLVNIRTQVLIRLIKPYTRISIAFIANVRYAEGFPLLVKYCTRTPYEPVKCLLFLLCLTGFLFDCMYSNFL